MKKIAVILLLLIYGTSAIGATVHLHYCMDEFAGWSLWHGGDEKCGRCGMEEEEKNGCCRDEHKHFKLKTEHQKSAAVALIELIAAPALITPVSDVYLNEINTETIFPVSNAPPKIPKADIYILHCVFLI